MHKMNEPVDLRGAQFSDEPISGWRKTQDVSGVDRNFERKIGVKCSIVGTWIEKTMMKHPGFPLFRAGEIW